MQPSPTNILDFLQKQDTNFIIPPYQRNYEWDEDQCKTFFDDVVQTTCDQESGKKIKHFFGTIIFYTTGSSYISGRKVILTDGQQRLTSSMLLVSAIRDEIKNSEIKENLNKKYLFDSNYDPKKRKIRLVQIEKDYEAYRQILFGEEVTNKDSTIFKNYSYFRNLVRSMADDKKVSSITSLIEFGLANLEVVAIELDPVRNPWENPQDIFESMNSLGKPLSLGDLVRNYLLMGMDAEEQELLYKKYWVAIENNVKEHVSDYIRDFMQMKGCRDFKKATPSNCKQLYRDFKNLFANEHPRDLLKNLSCYSEQYSWILGYQKSGNSKIDRLLYDFRNIKATIIFSLLLDLLTRWTDGTLSSESASEILDAFRIFLLRRRTIQITKSENKEFPRMSASLDQIVHEHDPRQAVFNSLKNRASRMRLPSDKEIREVLETSNFYSLEVSKLLLALVEEKLTKSLPNLEDKVLQKEHILPQTLTKEWETELGDGASEIKDELVDNLGNITLIRHNQELGNKNFSSKKKVYQDHSGLQIARTLITDQETWGRSEIIHRRDWLIRFLLDEVMPVPKNLHLVDSSRPDRRKRISMESLGLIGKEIEYIGKPKVKVRVVDDSHVEFEGKSYTLSGLVKELRRREKTQTPSESYQGPAFFTFDGKRLSDLYDNSYSAGE